MEPETIPDIVIDNQAEMSLRTYHTDGSVYLRILSEFEDRKKKEEFIENLACRIYERYVSIEYRTFFRYPWFRPRDTTIYPSTELNKEIEARIRHTLNGIRIYDIIFFRVPAIFGMVFFAWLLF